MHGAETGENAGAQGYDTASGKSDWKLQEALEEWGKNR